MSVIEPLGHSGVKGNHLMDNLQSNFKRNDSGSEKINGLSNNSLDSSGVISVISGTGSGKWNVTSDKHELSGQ